MKQCFISLDTGKTKEKAMLTIFADSFITATLQNKWNAPDHWTHHDRPLKTHEAEREAATIRFRSSKRG